MNEIEKKISSYLESSTALAEEWGIPKSAMLAIQAETIYQFLNEEPEQINLGLYELLDEIEVYEKKIESERKWYLKLFTSDSPYWLREGVMERIVEYEKKLQRLRARLAFLTNKKKGGITPEMVARAKEYDWNKLLEFHNGKAICPFHDDRHPSFSVKNGRGRCFGCGKSVDTIGFVMEKFGLSFIDAVQKLVAEQIPQNKAKSGEALPPQNTPFLPPSSPVEGGITHKYINIYPLPHLPHFQTLLDKVLGSNKIMLEQ